ncbi:MAG: hypothetical protein OEZ01_07955, partial [Candidatus Heimdallarchaeota archaeon]|nr:hypothetical protein [Candidatus Heimdallarchaeota archaeon]
MTTREDVEVFKDQANIYTMIVGGLIISAIIYFITSTVFNSLKNTTWSYINYILPIVIMYLSIVKGLQPDVIIKIFKNSGKIHAKSRKYYWEGNILEVDIFQVLQREIELKDHILTEF